MEKYVVHGKQGLGKAGQEYKVQIVDSKATAANPFMGAGGVGLRLVTDKDLPRGHLFMGSVGKDGKVKYSKKA